MSDCDDLEEIESNSSLSSVDCFDGLIERRRARSNKAKSPKFRSRKRKSIKGSVAAKRKENLGPRAFALTRSPGESSPLEKSVFKKRRRKPGLFSGLGQEQSKKPVSIPETEPAFAEGPAPALADSQMEVFEGPAHLHPEIEAEVLEGPGAPVEISGVFPELGPEPEPVVAPEPEPVVAPEPEPKSVLTSPPRLEPVLQEVSSPSEDPSGFPLTESVDLPPEKEPVAPATRETEFAKPSVLELPARDQETIRVEPARVLARTSQKLNTELKELEKHLSKTAPKQPLPSFQKRAIAAVRFLSTLAGTQRAMVLLEDGNQEFEVSAVGGMDDALYKTQTSLRLLKFVYLNREPLMLIDTHKDLRFGRDTVIRQRAIRSLLCVPFQDSVTGIRGLLYADNVTEPNAFTYLELRHVEAFAHKLATEESLGDFDESPVVSPTQLQTEVEPPSPWAYIALGLMVVVLAVPALFKGKESPKATETPTLVRRQVAQPDSVLVGFLRSLESRSLRGSYEFLSPLKKQELDFESFEKKWSDFLAIPENLWTVGHLKITPFGASQDTRKQFLLSPEGDGDPWRATLLREDDVWYLQDLDGPVRL